MCAEAHGDKFIETERLYLRNLTLCDVGVVCDWRNDEECGRYQRWSDYTEDDISRFISEFSRDEFLSEKREQHYGVCKSDTGELIGELAYFYSEGDCVTLGIAISRNHQRNGYAYEILKEVLARIKLKYPSLDVVALIERENNGSICLFEKLGFGRDCYAKSLGSYVYIL